MLSDKLGARVDVFEYLFYSVHGLRRVELPHSAYDQLRIEELVLSRKIENACLGAEIETIGDLRKYRELDLMKLSRMGRIGIRKIKESLREKNLSLLDSPERWLKSSYLRNRPHI
jgi:DNA-directed RNA polymerase alpha subunit